MCAAIDLIGPLVVGKDIESLAQDWGKTWRYLTSDSQLRWVGKFLLHSSWHYGTLAPENGQKTEPYPCLLTSPVFLFRSVPPPDLLLTLL